MLKNRVFNLDLYEIPLNEILQEHREFYGLRREFGESIEHWLKRVQDFLRHCEFPTIIVEFLLIDRFICGLNSSELRTIQSVSKSWTLKQLLEHVLDGNIDTGHMEANSAADYIVNQNQIIPFDLVKTEPVCSSLKCAFIQYVRTFLNFVDFVCIFLDRRTVGRVSAK